MKFWRIISIRQDFYSIKALRLSSNLHRTVIGLS